MIAFLFGEKKIRENIIVSNLPNDVSRWWPEIKNASTRSGVPAEIIAGVVWQESAGDPDAVGSAGERGLMQLKDIAVQDVQRTYTNVADDVADYDSDPGSNILAGSYYLKLQRENHSNWDQALEAYNQGAAGRLKKRKLAAAYRSKVNQKISRLK